MGFTEIRCVTVSCDGCGELLENYDEGTTIHFTSPAEAAAFIVTGDAGDWQVVDERIICQDCTDQVECARDGHDWADWYPVTNDVWTGRTRRCRRCDDIEFDPPKPVSLHRPAGYRRQRAVLACGHRVSMYQGLPSSQAFLPCGVCPPVDGQPQWRTIRRAA